MNEQTIEIIDGVRASVARAKALADLLGHYVREHCEELPDILAGTPARSLESIVEECERIDALLDSMFDDKSRQPTAQIVDFPDEAA